MADDIIEPDEAAAKRAKRKVTAAKWYAKNKDAVHARWERVYKADPEYFKSRARKWRIENRDRMLAVARAYYAANQERRTAEALRWNKAHPEKKRATNARWIEKHPGYVVAAEANHRARKIAAEGRFTRDDITRLFEAQSGKCAYCRKSIKASYHVDHIIPLAKGGSNWPKNLQLTCRKCNQDKNAKHPIDFARELGRLL